MLVDGKATTSVFSDPEVPDIDQAQYRSGEGPCLDAFRDGRVYVIASTEREERWPDFCRTASEHGVRSTLSLPMVAGGRSLGALNFYAEREDGFADAHRAVAGRFAAQAAAVLANAQAYWDARSLGENLTEAMKTRATIEQAKGIIMAQSKIGPDAAFEVLRDASQHQNRKLRDIAQELVDRHSGAQRG